MVPDTIRRGVLHEIVPMVILLTFLGSMAWYMIDELHRAAADRERLEVLLKRIAVQVDVLQHEVENRH